jgi:hypothetical protein
MIGLEAAQQGGGRGMSTSGAMDLCHSCRSDLDRGAVPRDDLPEPGEAALEMDTGCVSGEEGTSEPLEDRLSRA